MVLSKVVWSGLVTSLLLVAAPANAQIPPDVAPFIGNWTLAMEPPPGAPAAMTLNLTLKEESGKVQGAIKSDAVPDPQTITDITKVGASLVLRYTRDLQGQSIPVKLTLTPAGDKTNVSFELGEMITLAGTGTKK